KAQHMVVDAPRQGRFVRTARLRGRGWSGGGAGGDPALYECDFALPGGGSGAAGNRLPRGRPVLRSAGHRRIGVAIGHPLHLSGRAEGGCPKLSNPVSRWMSKTSQSAITESVSSRIQSMKATTRRAL